MNEIILAVLGPFAPWIMAGTLGLVILKRQALRRRHIVMLLTAAVGACIAFFGVLILGFVYRDMNAVVFQGVLFVLAGIGTGCASAIGFWLILKSVGLAYEGDD